MVWKPFFVRARRVPARNPPFHIKPLVRQRSLERQPRGRADRRDRARGGRCRSAPSASPRAAASTRPSTDVEPHATLADLDHARADAVAEVGAGLAARAAKKASSRLRRVMAISVSALARSKRVRSR